MAAKLTVAEFFKTLKAPTIVGLCGSQRTGSYNRMLHDAAMKSLESKGAIVKPIDIAALDLPLYNPNMEKDSFPQAAHDLKAALVAADGLLITSPEYNGFTSPLLLNALTWATRGEGDMYAAFKGTHIAVMATSPGPMGGLRMLRSLHQYLLDMGAIIVPGKIRELACWVEQLFGLAALCKLTTGIRAQLHWRLDESI